MEDFSTGLRWYEHQRCLVDDSSKNSLMNNKCASSSVGMGSTKHGNQNKQMLMKWLLVALWDDGHSVKW